jgi:DNA-binding CsgD family transcriptional regulator
LITLEQACHALPGMLADVKALRSLRQVDSLLLRITAMFDCQHGHFSIRRSLQPLDPGARRFTTYSEVQTQRYLDTEAWTFDPVYLHLSNSATAICFSEVDWSNEKAADLLNWLEDMGFGPSGLAMAVHGRCGLTAMFRIMSSDKIAPWATWQHEAKSLVASLTTHLFEAVKLLADDNDFVVIAISPREADCLAWSARGKTIGETAIILGIAQSTVRHALDSARQKLGAATKSQAVARAKELRLL